MGNTETSLYTIKNQRNLFNISPDGYTPRSHAGWHFPSAILIIDFIPREDSIKRLAALNQDQLLAIWLYYLKNFTFG